MSAPNVCPLQWGRRANATERVERGLRQLVAVALQWGRRANATERRSCGRLSHALARFNGAAARTRRRVLQGPTLEPGSKAASMGPPRERDGEHRRACQARAQPQLQWGRRANATERGAGGTQSLLQAPVSMGQPRERDGERRPAAPVPSV